MVGGDLAGGERLGGLRHRRELAGLVDEMVGCRLAHPALA